MYPSHTYISRVQVHERENCDEKKIIILHNRTISFLKKQRLKI